MMRVSEYAGELRLDWSERCASQPAWMVADAIRSEATSREPTLHILDPIAECDPWINLVSLGRTWAARVLDLSLIHI